MNKWVLPGIVVAVVIVTIVIIASISLCPTDLKTCPDGSYVARTGLSCEFEPCPLSGCADLGGYICIEQDYYLGAYYTGDEGYCPAGTMDSAITSPIHVCCTEPCKQCAEEGEQFSAVYTDQYPEKCCSGLTEWPSGMDTRISVEGECYETGLLAGSPVGTCINCGNGICESIENACNCPADCPEKSDYETAAEYCASNDWDSIALNCYPPYMEEPLPICDLCLLSIQQPCEAYTYSNCPEGCVKVCVPSECSDDEPPVCTDDCDGKESCLSRE